MSKFPEDSDHQASLRFCCALIAHIKEKKWREKSARTKQEFFRDLFLLEQLHLNQLLGIVSPKENCAAKDACRTKVVNFANGRPCKGIAKSKIDLIIA